MFGVGPVELILIAVVFIAVIFVVAGRGLAAMSGLFKGIQAGHATLTCPHCGQETAPTEGRCRSCGREL